MELQDGLIVGIFNYCDRWCERCAFTSCCRLFRDQAEFEAALDPTLKPVVDALPLAPDVEPIPAWPQERIAEANAACANPAPDDEWQRIRPRVASEHQSIIARANDYAERTSRWLAAAARCGAAAGDDPIDVIAWFHFFISVKAKRALTMWPDDDAADRMVPSDHDGSAKVALLGIERSHAAWLTLVERGLPAGEANAFIADLVWLSDALDSARPQARAFIRPGFDEPDEVAKLIAAEGAG
jgi:hypothetical protein